MIRIFTVVCFLLTISTTAQQWSTKGTKNNPFVHNGVEFWVSTSDDDDTPLPWFEKPNTAYFDQNGFQMSLDNMLIVFKAEPVNIRVNFRRKGSTANFNSLNVTSQRTQNSANGGGGIFLSGIPSNTRQPSSYTASDIKKHKDGYFYVDMKGGAVSNGITGRSINYKFDVDGSSFVIPLIIQERTLKYDFVDENGSTLWPVQTTVFNYGSEIDAFKSVRGQLVRYTYAINTIKSAPKENVTYSYVNTNSQLKRYYAEWRTGGANGPLEGGFITQDNYLRGIKEGSSLTGGSGNIPGDPQVEIWEPLQGKELERFNKDNYKSIDKSKIELNNFAEEVIPNNGPSVYTRKVLVTYSDNSLAIFPENKIIVLPGGEHEVFQNYTLTKAEIEEQLLGVKDNKI